LLRACALASTHSLRTDQTLDIDLERPACLRTVPTATAVKHLPTLATTQSRRVVVCTTHGSIMFDARSSATIMTCVTTEARSDPTSSRCQISRDGVLLWSITTVAELFSTDELMIPRPTREWWSQTGSNRRPPACKAGALPTELWPRRAQRVFEPQARRWWAWEDLNFRPHAYQARALTN
jgi:hypothetical protein